MPFSRGELRRGLDVYTLDGVYLGTVRAVLPGPPALEPTEGSEVPPAASSADGEALGPMPTQAVGNRGPHAQSPAMRYAAAPAAAPLGLGALVVGQGWRGRRTIPFDDILTVALERVVLRRRAAELARR
jgi:hypothetical protein